jgi:hypothetical protein
MKKFIFIITLLSLFVTSCYENPIDNPVGNKAPKTSVFLLPDSVISSQPSRLSLYWTGDDPDGFVIGYYFSWDGINWEFTKSNDSTFALQIGAADTSYVFKVAAVDDGGNGLYDSVVSRNGIEYGPEPFNDLNFNGSYDAGEPFTDIGLIDANPAEIKIPIKNSAPVITWNKLSFLPDTSFPVMTFSWNATDLDGDASISVINIALNDTNNLVRLKGGVRTVTLRTKDFNNPSMDILLDGNTNNVFSEKLNGLKLNDFNEFYVQAIDISGAKSPFIKLPSDDKKWFVKKPSGTFLIVDDYSPTDAAPSFYNNMMDSLNLTGKYDIYDIRKNTPPFINITFFETIKLFKHLLWYTDSYPSIDLASATTQKYIDAGGKIFFSMLFPQSLDLNVIQEILPILPDSVDIKVSIFPGQKVIPDSSAEGYPALEMSSSVFWVCSFYVNNLAAKPVYYLANNTVKSSIGFMRNEKNLFVIGLPLHKLNGGGANVKQLLQKVFNEFGL